MLLDLSMAFYICSRLGGGPLLSCTRTSGVGVNVQSTSGESGRPTVFGFTRPVPPFALVRYQYSNARLTV